MTKTVPEVAAIEARAAVAQPSRAYSDSAAVRAQLIAAGVLRPLEEQAPRTATQPAGVFTLDEEAFIAAAASIASTSPTTRLHDLLSECDPRLTPHLRRILETRRPLQAA